MARTTNEIIETMDDEQANQSALSGLTSTSQTAIFRLWKYIVAQVQNLLEQLWDAKQTQIEALLAAGVAPSTLWLRQKCFEFQYDATSAQILELIDGVPQYPVIDETKRLITRCTVAQAAGVVTITVAKNDPPEKLTAGELSALQGYFTDSGDGTDQAVGLAWAGHSILCDSKDPDLVFIEGTIYFSGTYASTINDACKAAFDAYLSELGQNPVIRITSLIDRLQDVPGFVDIHIDNMSGRDAGTPWPGGTALVTSGDVLLPYASVAAGYAVGETTASETFVDKMTFTAV